MMHCTAIDRTKAALFSRYPMICRWNRGVCHERLKIRMWPIRLGAKKPGLPGETGRVCLVKRIKVICSRVVAAWRAARRLPSGSATSLASTEIVHSTTSFPLTTPRFGHDAKDATTSRAYSPSCCGNTTSDSMILELPPAGKRNLENPSIRNVGVWLKTVESQSLCGR